jgi:hypothetical protein
VFNLVEEALDEIALAVKREIAVPLLLSGAKMRGLVRWPE